ncbi:MAG: hypothetical protein P4L28_12025 [Paludibacteraceae bacterium]|nr:hypothetical protein [Paludibacteraceae bacterium]
MGVKDIKSLKLRAFKIANDDIARSNSGLLDILSTKLKGSIAEHRRMLLNSEDPKKEEDLISDYYLKENSYVGGVVLRICLAEGIPNIPEIYLQKEKITMTELDPTNSESSIYYKDHYYFSLNNNFLVTNLQSNITISRLQTYINWLLQNERGEKLFEFSPMMVPLSQTKLSELKNIIVKDSTVHPDAKLEQNEEESTVKKLLSVSKSLLSELLNDTANFEEISENHIISAKLLIQFTKPRKMKKEDYEKIMSAYMKPISDTNDVSFTTKKGDKIKGTDILKTKSVEIELTKSGMFSENQVFQEMEKFLHELRNENNS